jgi:hypothetical protein
MLQVFDQLPSDRAILLALSSATRCAIASVTSSASPVSTLSEPKEIVDQFEDHAVKAGALLFRWLVRH